MIPKVANYGGFQSYGDKIYSNLKPGHKSIDFNDIWQQSTREQDKIPLYDSYNRNKTSYVYSFGQNVSQQDFVNSSHVQKGTDGVTDQKKVQNPSAVGTKHWSTTYASQIITPVGSGIVNQPDWATKQQIYQVAGSGAKSEYKNIYGDFGHKPEKVQNRYHQQQLMLENELRLGSYQMTKHTPGYAGFIPQVKTYTPAFEQSKGEKSRDTYLKQNIIENYQQRIPNYSGHIPTHYRNQRGTFRDEFFSLKGEKYH